MIYHKYCVLSNIIIKIMLQPISICVMFKAMGITSDQEIFQMIGTDDDTFRKFAPTLEECHNLNIRTQDQALKYLGTKLVAKRYVPAANKIKTPMDEARDLLATTILAHVPVENYNFKMKAVYTALMVSIIK